MTQDEIIRMAREAGIRDVRIEVSNGQLERFAALVAEATKEKAAKVCEELFVKEGDWPGIECRVAFDCAAAIRSMK